MLCHRASKSGQFLMRFYVALCESRGHAALHTRAFVSMTSLKYGWPFFGVAGAEARVLQVRRRRRRKRRREKTVKAEESRGVRTSSREYESVVHGPQKRRMREKEIGGGRERGESVFVSW